MKYFILFIILFSIQLNAQNTINSEEVQKLNPVEYSVYNWISAQQQANGLIRNSDTSSSSSLYNNALAALLFISLEDYSKAEAVFDYFNLHKLNVFIQQKKGFSQMRTLNGRPNNRTWMGDNAWLLIALNTYHQKTQTQKYQLLANTIEKWLRSLQDTDGGLWGGFEADGKQIPKNTEGMLDAFHAVSGLDDFHINILKFLGKYRWNSEEQHLTTSVEKHKYSIALDLHSWSICILEDFPQSALKNASKFQSIHKATSNNILIDGYCFDIDNDCVWLEGTGQMVVAYQFKEEHEKACYFLNEMTKTIIPSTLNSSLSGVPYVSNNSTNFGRELIWNSADNEASIASSIWFLYGSLKLNPFEIGFKRNIPNNYKFWIN